MPSLKSTSTLIFKNVSTQQLIATLLPAITILLAIVLLSLGLKIPLSNFTRDTSAIASINPVYGVLSNIGILLWCAATSFCAFAAVILKASKFKKKYHFLVSSALLSAYLMLDDLFLIHEKFSVKAGLNEDIVFALLGITVLVYLIYFRNVLLQTNALMLLLALFFFSQSLVADFLENWLQMQLGHWKYLIEDGTKWLGIAFWCSYFFNTSYQFSKHSNHFSQT